MSLSRSCAGLESRSYLRSDSRRLAFGLFAQCLAEIPKQLVELAGHQHEVDLELLLRRQLLIWLRLIRARLLVDRKKFDAFDLQLFCEDERDPIVPGQTEPRRVHARGEMLANLTRFQRIARVANSRLGPIRSLQLQILIDTEAQ